jgi:hypothetical protein
MQAVTIYDIKRKTVVYGTSLYPGENSFLSDEWPLPFRQ